MKTIKNQFNCYDWFAADIASILFLKSLWTVRVTTADHMFADLLKGTCLRISSWFF